jgi:hypothetical protein
MKTHNIFRKVGGILAEINEQYQYLSQAPENLNDLELELLSANADFLAEHIKVLKKLNAAEVRAAVPASPEPDGDIFDSPEYKKNVESHPEMAPMTEHLIKQEFPEDYSSFNNNLSDYEASQDIVDEEPPQEIHEPVEDDVTPEKPAELIENPIPERAFTNSFFIPEVQTKKAEQEQSPSLEAVALSDAPVSRVDQFDKAVSNIRSEEIEAADEPVKVPTLNELMSSQREQTSGHLALAKQKVTDLKSIINLNDKLLFIKDLFNGYSLAYSEAIELVNRFDSFEAADNFLKTNYAEKNNWAAKQGTVDKFYELLNKRFAM